MTNNDVMEWILVNVLGFATLLGAPDSMISSSEVVISPIPLDKALIVVNMVLALVLIVYNLIRIKQMLREEKKKGNSKSDTP